MIPPILQCAKEVGFSQAPELIFKALNEAILKETDMEYTGMLYAQYAECVKIIGGPPPQPYLQAFEAATQFQLETMGTVRQMRVKSQGSWDNEERLAEVDMEESENLALDEIAKAVHLVNENSSLLIMTGSVRELGQFAGTVDWEDEDDE